MKRKDIPALGLAALTLGAYLGVATGMTWPLVGHLTTCLPGGTTDTLVHYWNGWWVQQALDSGQSPFHTSYMFYPQGISLVYHNFAWLHICAWLVLKPLLGGFAAYNLTILVNLALTGFAAFLLTHDLTGDALAAFLAGLIYLCWPYRLSQLDHPNLISTQWIPLFLLFLARTLRRGRWQDGVLTGVSLALVGYTRWQLLIPAAIVSSIYLIFALPARWPTRRRWFLPLLLAAGIVALALASPFLLFVKQQRTAPAELVVGEEATMQTDLLAYLTPSDDHPLLAPLTRPAYERYYAIRSEGRRFPAYVGLIALILALLGAWRSGREGLPWMVMALILALLALGPTLLLNGETYPSVPMLYRLAARSFVIRLLRTPDRFNMFLALPIAVLAGRGSASLLTLFRRKSHLAAWGVSCLLCGVVLFEYLVAPVPLQAPPVSPFYAQMVSESGSFAVLNLPINRQKAKRYLFAQTIHQHPILQGKTARFPEGTYAYLDSTSWLWTLHHTGEMHPRYTDVSHQLTSLAEDGVRYLILHPAQAEADRLARWRQYLLIDPRFEDANIVVYPTTPQAGLDFVLTEELAPGIGYIRTITSADCRNPGSVLEVDVGWGATAPPRQNYQVALSLISAEGETQQVEQFPLSSERSTGEWTANTVAWGYYPMRIDPEIPGGTYELVLALVDPELGIVQGSPTVVGQVTVHPGLCSLGLPSDVTNMNILFGDELRLLGYHLDHEGDWLTLTLHWRSEQRMTVDYKVFVHIFDPATGAIVAQDDAMPRRWAYPTTLWRPGEVVIDEIPISLSNVPPGSYGVAVGAYDPATMERLPVVDEEGQRQPDDRAVLPGATVMPGTGQP